jgi:hypothetical protein
MYKHSKPAFEAVDPVNHPDYEIKDTRVSDYLKKYGTGKIEDLPQVSRPEITDNRTTDQMLDEPCEHMSTEAVDVMMEIERNKEAFDKAILDIKATQKQKKQFDDAVAALQDPNTPIERQREAYAILSDLERQGKLTRARKF